jgi:prevent-host-death family protein
MTTVLGVAEARAQLSDIVAQAVHRGTVTVIERYGKPAAAVVPIEVLAALERGATAATPLPEPPQSAQERHARLIEALDRLREVVELQTPEESDATFEAFNRAYRSSRGRDLER